MKDTGSLVVVGYVVRVANVDDRRPQGAESDLVAGAPTLEELLELAARSQSVQIGGGTLVGECLDTHHPHLPGRVFVRVRDRDGVPIMAWLPTLAELRIRKGQQVLVSKPDNWAEPLVMGVLAGLESRPPPRDEPAHALDIGPSLDLAPGEYIVIRGPDQTPFIRVAATDSGPELTLLGRDVTVEALGRLRIAAQQIEMCAGQGGVDIRTEGDTVVRSRTIRLN